MDAVFLSIKKGGKVIPYPRSENRDDGSKNHGFKPLRENLNEIDNIPEAQDIPALKNALIGLNAEESLFFTVGCEKAFIKNGAGHALSGYLEFAFNYSELAKEPQSYFKLFYAFNLWYWKRKQEAARYQFELESAHFLKAKTDGFTMSVWITIAASSTTESAQKTWESALNTLVKFLVHGTTVMSGEPYTRIY